MSSSGSPPVSLKPGSRVMWTAPDASLWHAVVTKVWGDASVNLILFPPDGSPVVALENVEPDEVNNQALDGIQLIDQGTNEAVWVSVVNGVVTIS